LKISKAALAAAAVVISLFTSTTAFANAWKMGPLSSQVPVFQQAQELQDNERREFLCLALTIYHEARGVRDIDGRRAVAHVVLNRSESPRFPQTVCGVVWDDGQFTWTTRPVGGIIPRERSAWLASQQLAYDTLYGTDLATSGDPTGGATHFHNVSVRPSWARNPLHTWRNGQHVFVRLRGF
jgi:N-acetylmuramoyl-L-alanine amidase